MIPICMHPDWKMARRKSWPAKRVAVRVAQLKPPALSPNMVTLLGSPPKLAMLSCPVVLSGGVCGGGGWVDMEQQDCPAPACR